MNDAVSFHLLSRRTSHYGCIGTS